MLPLDTKNMTENIVNVMNQLLLPKLNLSGLTVLPEFLFAEFIRPF